MIGRGKDLEKLAKTINENILDELRKENELSSAYQRLKASAKIPFEGEDRNLAGLSPFIQSPDRATRLNAQQARNDFFAGNGDGSFQAGVVIVELDINNHGSYGAYDFNGDGNQDIVISTYTSRQF